MKALLILLIGIVGFAFFLFGKVNNANLLLSHEDAAEKTEPDLSLWPLPLYFPILAP